MRDNRHIDDAHFVVDEGTHCVGHILRCFSALQEIIQKVKQSTNYASLLEYDQLLKLQRKNEALVGFRK